MKHQSTHAQTILITYAWHVCCFFKIAGGFVVKINISTVIVRIQKLRCETVIAYFNAS